VGAGVAVRAETFHPAVGAGVALHAVSFQLPVSATDALDAVLFHLAVGTRVTLLALVFPLAVVTPLMFPHYSPPRALAYALREPRRAKIGVVAWFRWLREFSTASPKKRAVHLFDLDHTARHARCARDAFPASRRGDRVD